MNIAKALALSAFGGMIVGISGCNSKPAEEPKGQGGLASASPDSTAAPAEGASSSTPSDKACCKGKNECKGKGDCRVPGAQGCRGLNECKGKGGCNQRCNPQ